MKIIYLDEPTYLTETFISEIKKMGEFIIYEDRPDKETAIHRLSNCDIAITEWTPIRTDMFERIKRLKFISLALTGHDLIDCAAAKKSNVLVSNCPSYSKQAVAEHVFALLLALNRKLIEADRAARQGKNREYGSFLSSELEGKRLGLLGTGEIGKAIAKIANGFGMEVVGTNLSGKKTDGITLLPLQKMLQQSDFVSVQIPANERTTKLINKDLLQLLKPTAMLINVSRGRIIDEQALYNCLKEGVIAGAGLDDLAVYNDNPLFELENVILSPSTGWYTREARGKNLNEILNNIKGFVNGKPINLVN